MLKIVNWNINGGYLIKNNSTTNNFQFFIDKIKIINPDIVLIQEGHINSKLNQIEELSKELDLKYYVFQGLGESHIEKGNQLCLFILSRFKLENVEFKEIKIPYFEKYNGRFNSILKSDLHKKGFLKAEILFDNNINTIICAHGHALYLFDKSLDDLPLQKKESINFILKNHENLIFGADMNYDKLLQIKKIQNKFSSAFKNEKTYKNKENDYILLSKKIKIINQKLDYCTDDHPLMYVEVEVK